MVGISVSVCSAKETDADDEGTNSTVSEQPSQDVIFSGTLPVPSGDIQIETSSGKSYKVPGMSPLGVLSALKENGSVSSYQIGDELYSKRGLLLLDGIDSFQNKGDESWYVMVEGRELRELHLPATQGLNTYPIQNDNVVLFVFGDPNQPVEDAKAKIVVTVLEVAGESSSGQKESIESNETTNTSVADSETSEAGSSEPIKTESSEIVNSTSNQTSTSDESASPEPEETDTPVSSDSSSEDETQTSESTPSKKSSSGQEVLYNGTFSVGSGKVNITAESGAEYDVSANTPLGLLNALMEDGKISDLQISDRGMRKGGILILDGINEYPDSGSEIWYVQINGVTLQDYLKPESDGLNNVAIKSGDMVGFYFGDPAESTSAAKAAIIVSIN